MHYLGLKNILFNACSSLIYHCIKVPVVQRAVWGTDVLDDLIMDKRNESPENLVQMLP